MSTDYNITKIQLPNGDTCTLPDKVKYIDVSKSGTTYSLPSGTTYTSIKALMDDNYICVLRVPSDWGYEYFYSMGDYNYIHDAYTIEELSFCAYSDVDHTIKYIRIGAPSYLYLIEVPILNPSLAGLTDTTITSPTDGQILVYNGTSGKWVNTSLSNGYFTVNHIIKSYTEFHIDYNHLSDGDIAWSLSDEKFYTFDLYNYTWNEDSSLNSQAYDGMIIYSITEGAFYMYNINESLKAISKGTPVITEANDGEYNFEQCIYLPVCDSSGDIYITPTSHSGSNYYLIIYGLYGTETCPLEQCGSDHVITIFNITNNDMTYTLQGDLYIGGEYDNIMSGVDDTTNSFTVPAGGVAEVNVHVTKYEINGAYAGGILNIIVKTDSVWNKTSN